MNEGRTEAASIPTLLQRLSEDTATLLRQELALMRAELAEKAKPVGASAGFFGATALFGVGAYAAITICFIAALALVLPVWGAALIVAAVYGVIAAVLAQRGRDSLEHVKPNLPQTTQSVKEDIEWAKTRMKSDAKLTQRGLE